MEVLLEGITSFTWQQLVMMFVGATLLYLGIEKKYEPMILLPMGFGTILVNFPNSGVLTQVINGEQQVGLLQYLFDIGISNEIFPLMLFIGMGAMIDFGPLLQNPSMMFFGAAAQFGIFFVIIIATLFGFDLMEASSIGIIASADGPTSIITANQLAPHLLGPITVAAYSYMALVPLIQPPAIRAVTTKAERSIRMEYKGKGVSQRTKLLFPILITIVTTLIAPNAAPLIGSLMYGNLLRESGVVGRLSETAQTSLVNLISIFLGLAISVQMEASLFLNVETLFIIFLGLVGFTMDTIGAVLFAKFLNVFRKEKINPMIAASGVSAFPMSARVVQKMAAEEDPQNFVLNYAVGANVSGQISSVLAAGIILSFFA